MPKFRRRIKLIQPRLQLKLILASMGIAALGLLFECLLFAACLAEVATYLPQDGPLLLESTPAMLRKVAFISCAGILPLVFIVGLLTTFRIAGPLYRFEVFLKSVIRGERPADCRLRKGDELTGMCELLNLATEPLRRREEDRKEGGDRSPDLHEAA